jgi:uncharacterized membrane protein
VRHWFNTHHRRAGNPHWTWAVAAILFIVIMWLSTVPKVLTGDQGAQAGSERFADSPHFAAVSETVMGRCAMCHAAEPGWQGIHRAPKDVRLDTEIDIAGHARDIYLQAGRSHAMPPGNVTAMTPEERRLVATWFEEAVR